jgi:hypothetical protein
MVREKIIRIWRPGISIEAVKSVVIGACPDVSSPVYFDVPEEIAGKSRRVIHRKDRIDFKWKFNGVLILHAGLSEQYKRA